MLKTYMVPLKDGIGSAQLQGRDSSVTGLLITCTPKGTVWRITHAGSGKRITLRSWPTAEVADMAAERYLSGIDWLRPEEELRADNRVLQAKEDLERSHLVCVEAYSLP